MKNFIIMAIAILSLGLTACDTTRQYGVGKQEVGAATGAVVGGLLGSKVGGGSGQLWATGAGAILGGLIGSSVGQSLDNADRAALGNANQRALYAPIGDRISWNNPNSGNYGYVEPVREGRDTAGRYCREYQQTIYVEGRQETGYGTACKMTDGTWEIIS